MRIRTTQQADLDIIDSYLYGFKNFGQSQAELYEQEIRNILDLIAENPRMGAERQEFDPPVRIHHHGSHNIIYVIEDDCITVLRILSDRMNSVDHLTFRRK